MRRMLVIGAPVGLGALVLILGAMAARDNPPPAPAKPKKAAHRAPAPAPRAADADPLIAAAPIPRTPTPAATEISADPATAAIQGRVRALEERLLQLEKKRNDLLAENAELDKRVQMRAYEHHARAISDWRVKQWEHLLGLSDGQKQGLQEMWRAWSREDMGRPAPRDTWLAREAELRTLLTAEQASKMHRNTSEEGRLLWSRMGMSLGGLLGASRDDHARYQRTLGDLRLPQDMLLPEAHGADWPGQLREALNRLQTVLTPDQMAKIQTLTGNR